MLKGKRLLVGSCLAAMILLFHFSAAVTAEPGRAGRQVMGGVSLAAALEVWDIAFGGAHGFAYSPGLVLISPGDSVRWQGDFSMHPLVSDEGIWETVSAGTEFSFVFNQPGVYAYHCQAHGAAGGTGMSGVVVVGQRTFLPLIRR